MKKMKKQKKNKIEKLKTIDLHLKGKKIGEITYKKEEDIEIPFESIPHLKKGKVLISRFLDGSGLLFKVWVTYD